MLVASARTIRTEVWCAVCLLVVMAVEVMALNGDHVCMVQQKYNITKRVKYRAPMSVRTYEWCFAMPPRCSKWSTEMRDLTRLETEERTAEVAVCCPGYKMRDVSCVPVCPSGKTGNGCSEDCPKDKWGPNCVYECKACAEHGSCSPVTGRCRCQDGWQGERCEMSMNTPTIIEELTITKPATMATSGTVNESTTSSSTGTTLLTTDKVMTTTTRTTQSATIAPLTTLAPTTVASTNSTKTPTTVTTAPTTSKIITTTTMRTPAPTTYMTSAVSTSSTSTIPTMKVATIRGNKEDSMSFTTANTFSIVNNMTSTTPWTLSTHKLMVTTQKLMTPTTESKTMKTTNTESVKLTTIPTMAPKIFTMTTMSPPLLETDASTNIEVLITTSKTAKENHVTDSSVKEATGKPEITMKLHPTTIKFKPKEIWIRPAQKGELLTDIKVKPNSELPKQKIATKKDITTITTPRTIIVSIIPTSITYPTFKKMSLTTSSYFPQKNVTEKPPTVFSTWSMSPSTSSLIKKSSTKSIMDAFRNVTNSKSRTPFTKETKPSNDTNSMSTTIKSNPSLTTIFSTNAPKKPWTFGTSIKLFITSKPTTIPKVRVTEQLKNKQFMVLNRNSSVTKAVTVTENPKGVEKTNDTNKITVRASTNVTEEPEDEETFHILTEPEHITAVMGEKGTERSSVDLISVISIAGGVMMTVITVAVVIVMLERCKRPRYEEAKMNNIRMQVMIDNNDGPPPYVRSIFNTPLPEPPSMEKCHYQPISTLDRNLKQFMRPVVVQTISPMMLENFRGILECHYDHLPRRSIEFHTLPRRHSLAPPVGGLDEPRQQRPDSLAESAIEALKCEAKLDVIDNTTSEPLYAEIPCWRPPSEHAVEIVNLNGEAVTEL